MLVIFEQQSLAGSRIVVVGVLPRTDVGGEDVAVQHRTCSTAQDRVHGQVSLVLHPLQMFDHGQIALVLHPCWNSGSVQMLVGPEQQPLVGSRIAVVGVDPRVLVPL